MKRLVFAFTVIALASSLVRGESLIASNSFEGVENWTLTAQTGIMAVTNLNLATDTPATNRVRSGSYSLQQAPLSGSAAVSTSDFASVALGSTTARQVQIHVSSISSNGTNGADSGDSIHVFVALDGAGFSSTPDIRLHGNSNARWGFTATNRLMTYAGVAISNAAPQGGTSITNYSRLLVNVPNSSTSLALRIRVQNDALNEVWCIDDLRLVADAPDWTEPATSLPPSFQNIGNKTTTNNQALTFNVTALDNAEQDTVTLSASNLPFGATFNTVTNAGGVTNAFSWNPAGPPGVYTAAFWAVDNDGATSSNVLITVLDPPLVTVTTPAQTVAYSQTTIAIEGTASTNAVGEFSWTNTLTGAAGTIPAASAWQVNPVTLAVGANVFSIRVTNLFGEAASSSVTITRDQPPLPGCTNLILFQGFEGADTWTIASGSESISNDTGAADFPSGQRIASGSASWQVQGLSTTLDLAQVSISGYTGRYVEARVASLSLTSGNGADGADAIALYVAVDGAAFAGTADLSLAGNSNARWGFWATNSYNALAAGGTALAAPQGSLSSNNYSTLRVILPDSATSVALRVWAQNNTNAEIWAVDNIGLYGCPAGAPPADSDGDGMLDVWEQQYFSGSLTNEAAGDFDSDGVNNLDEYIADTIPSDAGSYFKNITNVVLVAPLGVLNFTFNPSSTGRIYDAVSTTNLLDGAGWQSENRNLPGNGGALTLSVTNSGSVRHYRTQIRLP